MSSVMCYNQFRVIDANTVFIKIVMKMNQNDVHTFVFNYIYAHAVQSQGRESSR